MSVLLLNASYDPLRVISLKRAVVLVMQEKAEILEESDALIRSEKLSFNAPSVIKLKYFVQIPYRAKLPLNNRNVVVRDKGECAYCDDRKATTVDHVVPRSRGGLHRWENVVAACYKCNAKKSDRLLSEIGWEPKWKPYAPSGTRWLILGMKPKEEWVPYLGEEECALSAATRT
jgi:5-methylcytosine-specific restriction endonuclease McrA